MKLFNLRDLVSVLPPGQRLIGLDPGVKRIGVALSDVTRAFASPYGTLKRAKLATNAAEIRAIADREGVGGLVIGLPLSLDGSVGPAAQSVRDWALALSAATNLPTAMWDERLSSALVNRMLIQADLSRARRAELTDPLAAAYILQSALDASNESSGRSRKDVED